MHIETEDKEKELKNVRRISVLSIIIAGCLWGSMGLWVHRFSSEGLDSIQILALRAVAAVVLLGIFLSIYNRKLFIIKLKDLWCFVGTGVLSVVFFGYCYNRTILLTSMSVAAILLYTAPIFVMILSRILFGEKFTPRKVAALLLAFAGCICVTGIAGGQESIQMTGILTGLGSGFGYALYSIFSRFALERNYHPFTVTFYTFVCAMMGTFFLTDPGTLAAYVLKSAGNLFYTAAYGMVTTAMAYIFYTLGLKYVENSRASIMATIEPVVATLLGVFILGEPMGVMNLAGVVMVLAAVVMLA